MSHTIIDQKETNFNLNNWLNILNVMATPVDAPDTMTFDGIAPTPNWLEIKGPATKKNAFAVTGAVVKCARKIIDGLNKANLRVSETEEKITMQVARSYSEDGGDRKGGADQLAHGQWIDTETNTVWDPKNDRASGYNPDGNEHDEIIITLRAELSKLKAIASNGAKMLTELLEWIDEWALTLELQVEVGHTMSRDLIGNESRIPCRKPLDRDNLRLAIQAQREWMANRF